MRLTIRRDATIVVHEGGDEPIAVDRDDGTSILNWLRSPVELEEGMTAASLFRALRPWSAVLSRLAWMDFDAWDDVVSRAHLREVGTAPEADATDPAGGTPRMTMVEIGTQVRVDAPSGRAILSVPWRTYGVSEEGDEEKTWNLSLTPLSSWIHLPLRINPYSVVNERFLKDAGMAPRGGREGAMSFVRPIFVAPTLWDAVIKGFLDGISATGSPEEARVKRERIANVMAEMREIETMRPAYIPNDGA